MKDEFKGSYEQPTQNCPYWGTVCEADWVDIGVGVQQCGPYYCENCGASQIGLYDKNELTGKEQKGWYLPSSPMGSSVNTIDGIYVDHQTAKKAYKLGLLDKKNK